MEYLSWIAAIVSLVSILLAIREVPGCWHVSLVGNIVWLIYSILTKQYAQIFTNSLFACVSLYGIIIKRTKQ
jgi:nicotinamide riboside transporter PnuC